MKLRSKWLSEIKGFENFIGYKIYDNGEVFSYKYHIRDKKTGRIIKSAIGNTPQKISGSVDSKGYRYIDIKDIHGKRKCPKIHRLVGLAFVDNPENKPQINHIDCDKLNNNFSNLEWVTNSENQKHAYKHGLNKPHKKQRNYQWFGNHKNCKPVNQYDLEGNFIASYKSLAMAGRAINRSQNRISDCCNGRVKKAYGYRWEFAK